MGHEPEGHTSAAPYLLVRDARAVLDFLRDVFGAEALRVIPKPPERGGIMHAEARVEDSVIMMGEVPDGVPAHVHVYVADVDAAFARAVAAGGTVVQPVEEKGDGDRRGGVRDPHGTTWWIATQVGG